MTQAPTMVDGRRLVLWAEGSSQTGLGHLMRLFALGQAWADAGGRVEAVLGAAPDAIVRRYEAEGLSVRPPLPDGADPADELAGMLRDDPSARGAIDRPNTTLADLDRLGEAGERTILVDDMAVLDRYPVGLVLNQNAHADRAAYPAGGDVRYLLGPRYVVLRREFRAPAAPRAIPDRARRLLITFGGADPTGMTRRTIEAVLALPPNTRRDLEVRVVLGAANQDDRAVSDPAERADLPIIVERGVEDMVTRMAWADLAVSSGGSTVWELARTGCPSLIVETAPAEPALVRGLERLGLFDRLGPADRLDGATLRAAIDERLGDRDWRAEMSDRGATLVDGHGAERVVEALAAVDGR